MPIIDGAYVAPTWNNNANPAINSTELQAMSDTIQSNQGKAPVSHANPNTTYGIGNATNYGHVKLSDTPNSSQGATSGVSATPKAVKAAADAAAAAQTSANAALSTANGKAPASVSGTYIGTGTFGINNKNSLAFTAIPNVIYISNRKDVAQSAALTIISPPLRIGYTFVNSGSHLNALLDVGVSGNTVYWYVTNGASGAQSNNNGERYTYVALY